MSLTRGGARLGSVRHPQLVAVRSVEGLEQDLAVAQGDESSR